VAGDEDPLQRPLVFEHSTDGAPAADVPGVGRRASLGQVEQIDAQRLGDALPVPGAEVGCHADDASGAIESAELGGPPAVGRLVEVALGVAGRLTSPGAALCGVGGSVERGDGRGVERLAGWPDRRDGGGAVRDVPERVQREGDLVDDAPHDGERKAGSGLPFPPVVRDDPAPDPGFGADASVGDEGDELAARVHIGRGHERAGCRLKGPEVGSQRR
jgi:hypothetical protein